MSECVTGYIDHIIFRNEDNGYTVMVLKGVKDEDELTCVGTFPADREDAGRCHGYGTLSGFRRY